MDKKINKAELEKQKAVYACVVCEGMFKDPGMCPDCNQVLKKGAG